jgi:uncharacterized membrane protein YoaK (UPF0700 family)
MVGRQDTIVLLLAVVGAGVDAVMITAFGVLTAAQTGNTILLGVAIGQGRWGAGLAAGASVIGYVVGTGVGEWIIEGGGPRRGGPPFVARALGAEMLLLALVLLMWRLLGLADEPAGQDALVALAAVGMGIQSAVTLRLHAGPTTTYVTGTLTTFMTGMIRRLRWSGPEPCPMNGRERVASTERERPWIYGATWAAYAAGAVVTALLAVRSAEAALLLPIAVLAAVMATTYVPS